MDKRKLLIPAGILSAGAAALLLMKKKPAEAKAKAAPAAAKAAQPANAAEGAYSFVSGYKDAQTRRLGLKYDADAFSFAVVSEDYLIYSGDSHVALLTGEDYNVQIEYAAYYTGEGFDAMAARAREKYATCADVTVNGIRGIRYIEGDAVVTCLEADEYSYVIVSAMKAKESKIALPDIVNEAPLAYMFSTVTVE